jgi:putative ABC transport system substrate-binding protein
LRPSKLLPWVLWAALPALADVPRVGMLASTCDRSQPFHAAMRELGYVEGRNVEYDCVVILDRIRELPRIAADMAARGPSVIVTASSPGILAAKRATTTIPIVMHGSADAIREGFVASLSRPGGNVTGVTGASFDLLQKRLELGRELLPKAKRLGIVYRRAASAEPFMKAFTADMARLASQLGFDVKYHPVDDVTEAVEVIRGTWRDGTQVLYLVETPILQGPRIAELARAVAASRLPAIGGGTNYCLNGVAIVCVGGSLGDVAKPLPAMSTGSSKAPSRPIYRWSSRPRSRSSST